MKQKQEKLETKMNASEHYDPYDNSDHSASCFFLALYK